VSDSGAADSGGGSDSGAADSGSGSDSGAADSGSGPDSGAADSGSGPDSGAADSGSVSDSGAADSGSTADSGTADTLSSDCTGKANDTPCSTGKLCYTGETCQSGTCSGGAVNCDDGNACTQDSCEPDLGGCVHGDVPQGTACNQGDPCVASSTCNAGICKAGANTCTACKDTSLACSGNVSLLASDPGVTSAVSSLSCGSGVKTPGKEVSFLATTTCNGAVSVVVRVYGTGTFGNGQPLDKQTAHVYLIDDAGSAQACGISSAQCAESTLKQQACGTTGGVAKAGCQTEFLVQFLATGPGVHRVIVDSLTNGSLTEVQALMTCQCNSGGVCGDGKCDANEDCNKCAKDCGVCPKPVCGDGKCVGDETCKTCKADCGACQG
jgi:hypothetical protein